MAPRIKESSLTPVLLALVACLFGHLSLWAESPFAVVFIDEKTEQRYGEFPLERSILARGIDAIKSFRPKAIVVKFFFDVAKNAETDRALAKSFDGVPVLLQARLDDSEKTSNPLGSRFFLTIQPEPGDKSVSGESGWIPLESFAAHAFDIGFVDFLTPDKVPMLEKYQGRFVKSLYLCALESALGAKAQISPGKQVTINGVVIKIDGQNQATVQLPAKDDMTYVAFHDVLSGKAPAKTLEGKVVILGYDGAKIDSVDTPRGRIRSHRLFFYGLDSLYKSGKS